MQFIKVMLINLLNWISSQSLTPRWISVCLMNDLHNTVFFCTVKSDDLQCPSGIFLGSSKHSDSERTTHHTWPQCSKIYVGRESEFAKRSSLYRSLCSSSYGYPRTIFFQVTTSRASIWSSHWVGAGTALS